MEKRKAAMWKEAAMPSAVPSPSPSAVPRRPVHRGAMPATMPATNRPRLGRSSDQCSAERDRRRETSQLPFTRIPITHRRAPKTRSPHANEVAASAFIPCAANQISEKTERKCTKFRRPEPDSLMNVNSCARSFWLACAKGKCWRRFAGTIAALNSRRDAGRSRCRSTCCPRRSNARSRSSRAAGHSRSRSGRRDRP